MNARLIARKITPQDGGPPRTQTLEEHSRNAARHCAALCRPFGLEKLGELTGWLHDVGKAAPAVQDHIQRQTAEKLNHSAAGMRWIWEQAAPQNASVRMAGQMVALAIGCHHGRRCDYLAPDGSQPWLERMRSEQALSLYRQSVEAFFCRLQSSAGNAASPAAGRAGSCRAV